MTDLWGYADKYPLKGCECPACKYVRSGTNPYGKPAWAGAQDQALKEEDVVRTFDTGATRDTDEGKPSYAGFLSPLALHAFGQYMLKHQVQSDGTRRAADNWKKGIPMEAYLDSLLRHVMDVWLIQQGYSGDVVAAEDLEEALCACLFNVQGMLHETLKQEAPPSELEGA